MAEQSTSEFFEGLLACVSEGNSPCESPGRNHCGYLTEEETKLSALFKVMWLVKD